MKNESEHQCAKVSAEDLLLHAYGEDREARIEAHLKQCAACRAYLEQLRGLRTLVQKAGTDDAGDAVVGRLKNLARQETSDLESPIPALVPGPRSRRYWKTGEDREKPSRWGMTALAALAVAALSIAVYWTVLKQPAFAPTARPKETAPVYLAGVNDKISELESLVNEQNAGQGDSAEYQVLPAVEETAGDSVAAAEDDFSLDPGAWDLIMEQNQGIEDLELTMLDLEDNMGLLSLVDSGEQDEAPADEIEKDGVELENLDLPLLPGSQTGTSL